MSHRCQRFLHITICPLLVVWFGLVIVDLSLATAEEISMHREEGRVVQNDNCNDCDDSSDCAGEW